MSAAFFMALLDEYNFKKKRLADAYGKVADLSDSVANNEIDYPEICAKVDAVINKGKGAKNNGEKAA
jgi:hypothetical protein